MASTSVVDAAGVRCVCVMALHTLLLTFGPNDLSHFWTRSDGSGSADVLRQLACERHRDFALVPPAVCPLSAWSDLDFSRFQQSLQLKLAKISGS